VLLLVTFVLLGPALLLGAWLGVLVRRRPATDTGRLRTLALIVAVVGGVVLGTLVLLVRSNNSSLLRVDRSIAPWGEHHMTTFSRWTVDLVTSFGGTTVVVGTALGVFVFEMLRRPSRWLPVFLATVVIGQTLLSSEIKSLVDRIRPTINPLAHTLGPAFPSGHTTGAAACAAAFALVLGRGRSRDTQAALAGAAVFLAVAVAASRVLLGVHWLTDVLGGLALGWGWFALCSTAFGGRLLGTPRPGPSQGRFSPRSPPRNEPETAIDQGSSMNGTRPARGEQA
jgi:membrane-associated phospholipid phosphatase